MSVAIGGYGKISGVAKTHYHGESWYGVGKEHYEMILERRSIPYHYRPYSVDRSYPLNRFSDIIELAGVERSLAT